MAAVRLCVCFHNTHESYVCRRCRAKFRARYNIRTRSLNQNPHWVRASWSVILNALSVFHCHCPRAQLLAARKDAHPVRKAKNRLPNYKDKLEFCSVFFNKMLFVRIFDEWYKTTHKYDPMKWSIYYLDVIKMTITLAFVSGNGHLYHISVIELTIS